MNNHMLVLFIGVFGGFFAGWLFRHGLSKLNRPILIGWSIIALVLALDSTNPYSRGITYSLTALLWFAAWRNFED